MDRKTLIGIVLIILVTLFMPFYQKWITGGKKPQNRPAEVVTRDTTAVSRPDTVRTANAPAPEKAAPMADTLTAGKEIAVLQDAPEVKTVELNNKYVHAVWSTKNGGNPVYWELKNYGYYKGGNVNLIDQSALDVSFLNRDGKEIDLTNYNMFADFQDGQKIDMNTSGDSVYTFQFYLPVAQGRIVKTVTFYPDKYSFDVAVRYENLANYVINRKYAIAWKNGLPSTEENLKDDLNYTKAFAYMAEDLEDVNASDKKYTEEEFKGYVDWVAVRTKYFLSAIIPHNPKNTLGAVLGGIEKGKDHELRKIYNVSIDVAYSPERPQTDHFTVYLGPLDYYVIKKYQVNLQKLVMNNGLYERLFRPISLLIIPAFEFLYRFIPNYGLVIIIFSILIKILLYPLTKKSFQSMSEMQFLQPKMAELKEKYKDDPQRLNKEMMKLYKEHGVNPLGGCLPTLLQMPLLFSLFIVFRSTIQLRGKPFLLWITDLSRADSLHLGFNLPLVGNNIHVLPILMGLTMIWQSKMSMTDPKQKAMVYFMPLFMIFIFYSLPSGLNLYYAVFNVLSMIQTHYIKKKTHPGSTPEPAKAVAAPSKKRGKKSK